jgi:hypothetical protein
MTVHKELVERVSNVMADAAGFYNWLRGDGKSVNADKMCLWESVIKNWIAKQLDASLVAFSDNDLCVVWAGDNWQIDVWVQLSGWVSKLREVAGLIDSPNECELKLSREQVFGVLVQYM